MFLDIDHTSIDMQAFKQVVTKENQKDTNYSVAPQKTKGERQYDKIVTVKCICIDAMFAICFFFLFLLSQ